MAISPSRGTLAVPSARMPSRLQNANRIPSSAAGEREQQAFGQQLTDDAAAACAEGASHQHFLLASERARQQQVRDVGARDQQDEADGADQDRDRLAYVAHDLLAQRDDAEGQAAVGGIEIRMVAAEARGERVHFRLGRSERRLRA